MKRTLLVTMLFLLVGMSTCADETNELTGDGIVTVGIYVDEQASGICYIAAENMFKWMGFETKRIYAATINSGAFEHIDIFYFPGGGYGSAISDSGLQMLRDVIASGRSYIGTCGGAYFARYLGIFPGLVTGPVPGLDIGMCEVYLMKPHPITDDQPASLWILYFDSPYFVPDSGAAVDTIGFYNVSGYPALVACEYGAGRVFLTGPHPEWEENDNRDGVSAYDIFDDVESDWPMMHNAARWCLYDL
jgi:glutamine amidotransferase-like uncharacterized protein